MAAADVRDMLDLPADGQPRPTKKQKVVEKRPGEFVALDLEFKLLTSKRGNYSGTLCASR
jgi:hypothetical protein